MSKRRSRPKRIAMRFTCAACGFSRTNEVDLDRVLQVLVTGERFVCPMCGTMEPILSAPAANPGPDPRQTALFDPPNRP